MLTQGEKVFIGYTLKPVSLTMGEESPENIDYPGFFIIFSAFFSYNKEQTGYFSKKGDADKMARKSKKQKQKIPRLINQCGWLLVLESIEFFVFGVYHFHLNNGPFLFSTLFSQWLRGETAPTVDSIRLFVQQLVENAAGAQLLVALNESAVLFLLTILTLWSAVGFFRLWPVAWTAGVFVQGGALLTSLILYFLNKPKHIVIMMVTGIFMVLYLNYADVQAIFLQRRKNAAMESNG